MLGASRECLETLLAGREWAIPAGAGAFIATFRGLRYRDDDSIVLATAGTWVATAMLHPNQEAQVAALQFRQSGRTLRDGLMLMSVSEELLALRSGRARFAAPRLDS